MKLQEHPLFFKYQRDWLHEMTGYSKGYLSRVATGNTPLSRAFIQRVCFRLQLPESELFLTIDERGGPKRREMMK